MKAQYCELMVSKSMMHKQLVSCFTHEIPVYKAKYRVEIPDDQPKQTADVDPEQEFARLEKKHGGDEKGSFALQIYGNPITGKLPDLIGVSIDKFRAPTPKKPIAEEPAEVKDEPNPLLEGLPKGSANKGAIQAFFDSVDLDIDASMNKEQLDAFALSTIPQMLVAADPNLQVPDVGSAGMIKLYKRVTAG